MLQFFLFLYQCSDTEQYSEKPFQKWSENSCPGFFFREIAGFWGNWRKNFITVSFGRTFVEIFQISFFLKQLRANLSDPSRPLWDFSSVLEDVTLFLQVNFDTCSLRSSTTTIIIWLNKQILLSSNRTTYYFKKWTTSNCFLKKYIVFTKFWCFKQILLALVVPKNYSTPKKN